jgi:hypothetical protein
MDYAVRSRRVRRLNHGRVFVEKVTSVEPLRTFNMVHCKWRWDQLDAANSDLLVINYSSTCFERLYAHRQEVGLRFTAYGFLSCYSCDARESGGRMCALWRGCCLNNYNRTENHRQWNEVRPPDDGRKDARNMLRNNWLLINHYLLHLVGLTFIYL